ncbi:MAG: DUF1934 domain-containing protein [Ruminococcus sp.]|nr:DUF1934 domain-containing protein [Ruminococcus sp.]MBQ9516021.1 DUF1934 domain-containing protein [Ruminococcus sp.]
MNDNYLITVIGKQTVDGESDSIEVITSGDCRIEDNGDITITYPEFSEENPTVRTDTTVSLRGNILTIERRGQMSSRLILEKGRRHQCLYETPMGQMFIGIFTDGIEVELDKSGGDIRASYQLDFNQNVVSYNEFYINIKEKDLK